MHRGPTAVKRTEFIRELTQGLRGLSLVEVALILARYDERFQLGLSRGLTEEEISRTLEPPHIIAGRFSCVEPAVLAECGI
jgi:uncharacterized membrane protein